MNLAVLKLKTVLADKAYDSEENLRFVLKELKAKAQIPTRDYPNSRLGYGHKACIGGKLRRRMFNTLDLHNYHQRSLIESVISSIKRLYGASVNSRLPNTQEKQAILKTLTYNIKKTKHLLKITIYLQTWILQSLFYAKSFKQAFSSFNSCAKNS